MTESELLKHLAKNMRLSVRDTERLILTAPRRYKRFSIEKRSGGERIIAQPSVEVKALQRFLINTYPDSVSAHDSATAYEKGSSIVRNAQIHSGRKWIAKFDFENFFPNIRAQNWEDFLIINNVPEGFHYISAQVFFWKKLSPNLTLSVGAPSSPFVSNRIMFSFDEKMSHWAKGKDLSYSRYADDITVSSNSEPNLNDIERAILQNLSPYQYCKINKKKTRKFGPGEKKIVTGLVLANDGSVGLGRDLKRKISAAVHNLSNGKESMKVERLRGYLGLLKMTNFEDYLRLKNQYAQTFAIKKL